MTLQHDAAQAAESDGGFEAISDAMASAMLSTNGQTHRYSIEFAGCPVELVVVGDHLASRVFPAFAHLEGNGLTDDLARGSIAFLDADAAGSDPVLAPSGGEWVAQGEGWRMSIHGAARYLSEARRNSLICLDRATGSVAALFRTAADLSLADRARPLQRMMSQICASYGVQDIHAGLVAREGTGVLIVGGSGRGKTTTTIDCLVHGLEFLGDDSVAIREAPDQGFTGYSLYGSARVLPGQFGRWPELADDWNLPGPMDDKALLLPSEAALGRVVRQCKIAAIVVPRVTDGAFRVSPTSPRAAFLALVHDSEDNRRFRMSAVEFRRLATLTKETPCFLCELDTNPATVAAGVANLIESLAA